MMPEGQTSDDPKRVAILGSTGSIGQSTLEVIASLGGSFHASALTAHSNFLRLVEQAQTHRPHWVVATDAEAAEQFDWSGLPSQTELLTGEAGVRQVVTDESTDIVVAAMVGSAGLTGTWAALEQGKRVALANKETLVMAGPLVMQLAAKHQGELIPIDSEHSAIFQALQTGNRSEVRRIILTASGGPFRQWSTEQLSQVTVEQALAHPTWEMGPKISVDSATLMNKALEMIEARWLFDLEADQIEVVIHPQSVIHSMVEFVDSSVVAQLSPPDMKLPIQYALTYPERVAGPAERMDWKMAHRLEFDQPDESRFPAVQLGRDVARAGGTAGAVVNAANEEAVASFLSGKLQYNSVVPVCRRVLDNHPYEAEPRLARLIELDAWAREEVRRCLPS